jgi:hypothetical protein
VHWQAAWFDGAIHPLRMAAWRGVESQYLASTMRLVDSPAEQDLLEQLLEASKPPAPRTAQPLHYLLTTPFRYHPPHASRFRPAHAQGQWYGAEQLQAACAEVAYWRHRFLLDSAGLAAQELLTEHSFFQAEVQGAAIDLTAQPWVQARAQWTHGSDYTETQAVAAAAQAQGALWLRYESVRAPGQWCAVVFDPQALSEPRPGGLDRSMQRWHCKTTRERVMFSCGRTQRYAWDF